MNISNKKKEKISEQIISLLFSNFPKAVFTVYIAKEIIRDEEFTKKLLISLREKNLVKEIKKNPQGKVYLRRSRWKLTEEVYSYYKHKTTR
jgi:hypothetical protein